MGRVSCSLEWEWRLLRQLVELPEQGWDERLQASQPGKREHQRLAVGYALGMEAFVTKEEDSRWSLYEPSRELQRKKEKKGERRL